MLTGEEIIRAIKIGELVIEPFNESNVNPNSYNLTLGDELMVYTDDILDCKKKNGVKRIPIPDDGYILSPNTLYLASTQEYTENNNYIPQISGRSSVGRIGLSVHLGAESGDIGFKGTWTLQITCLVPTKVYKGMEIGQIYYFPIIGDKNIKYDGNYNNQRDIKSSKIYKTLE